MEKDNSELVVIRKAYELVACSARRSERFPRSHRLTLGDRMASQLYRILEMLIRARYTADRLPILRDTNIDLEVLAECRSEPDEPVFRERLSGRLQSFRRRSIAADSLYPDQTDRDRLRFCNCSAQLDTDG